MNDTKICTKCNQERPKSEFKKDKNRKDGLFPQCKICVKADREKTKSKDQEYMKKYREEHKEKLSQDRKTYYQDHAEEERANRKTYYQENHEKELKTMEEYRRSKGMKPAKENKDCSLFLGVHITENAVKSILPNAKRMPTSHPKYDYLCSKGYKVDVKSATTYQHKDKNAIRWEFKINKNIEADYFLCTAYDNKEDLNIIKMWMIPGALVNHLGHLSISPGSFQKWSEYEIDPSEAQICVEKIQNA